MKLLILTQVVDQNNSVLGFFHGWLEKLVERYEQITVVALQVGEFHLPANVAVHSLGKENGISRLKYLWRFYRYLWRERQNYEAVFVHMNQEYVLLGGLIWKFLGKRIYLWRNHAQGNFWTRLSVWLSDKVFCTSRQSFTAQFTKTEIMPAGIDTDFFQPDLDTPRKSRSLLFLGRLAPVKNVGRFLHALDELHHKGVDFQATIAGAALPSDAAYEQKLRQQVAAADLKRQVKFIGAVTQLEARQLYREHEIYVNLTPPGSLDKTIFEAMACGVLTVAANPDLGVVFPAEYVDKLLIPNDSIEAMTVRLTSLLEIPPAEIKQLGQKLREVVVRHHSLGLLVEKLAEAMVV